MPITRPTLTYLAETGVRDGTNDVFRLGNGEVAATRKFRGDWSERTDLAKYFLGMVEISYDGSGDPDGLMRLLPQPHPDYPNMYASRIEVNNNHAIDHSDPKETLITGDLSTRAKFRKVDFTVTYEKPRYVLLEDGGYPPDEEHLRFVERPQVQGGYDVLVCPAGSMKYYISLLQKPIIPFGAAINQPIAKLTFKWCDLPPDLVAGDTAPGFTDLTPWQKRILGDGTATNRSYLGCVNSDWWKGYPPWSLLLDAVRIEPRPSPVDDPAWELGIRYDVYFEISYKSTPYGWNGLYYHDVTGSGSGYYYVTRENPAASRTPGTLPSDNASMYAERDFNELTDVRP